MEDLKDYDQFEEKLSLLFEAQNCFIQAALSSIEPLSKDTLIASLMQIKNTNEHLVQFLQLKNVRNCNDIANFAKETDILKNLYENDVWSI